MSSKPLIQDFIVSMDTISFAFTYTSIAQELLFGKISVTSMGKCAFLAKLTLKIERHSKQHYTNTPHRYSSLRRKHCCVFLHAMLWEASVTCWSWPCGVFAVPSC